MAFPKEDPTAREWFDALVPDDPRVKVRPMFGNRAAFEPMPGRSMKEYVVLPTAWRDDTRSDEWVHRSLGWAWTLPPKKKK